MVYGYQEIDIHTHTQPYTRLIYRKSLSEQKQASEKKTKNY